MKAILLLIIPVMLLSSCVTPAVSFSTDPPGVCVGIPVVPVDLCLHVRTSSGLLSAKRGEPVKVGLRQAINR